MVHDSEVIGNSIQDLLLATIWIQCHWHSVLIDQPFKTIQSWIDDHIPVAMRMDRVRITLTIGGIGILSFGDGAPRHDISNNVIDANRDSHAIWSFMLTCMTMRLVSTTTTDYAMISRDLQRD